MTTKTKFCDRVKTIKMNNNKIIITNHSHNPNHILCSSSKNICKSIEE